MPNAVLTIEGLPDQPLDAAAYFYAEVLPGIRRDFAIMPSFDLTIVFEQAGHEHRAWRLALVQELARDHAPARVNAVASGEEAATKAAVAYLQAAHGVTGQLLPLDGNGACEILPIAS